MTRAVCCLCGAQQQWNPRQKHVLLVSDPQVQKTIPKLQQFPLGPTLTTQEPRTMSNLYERATSTENKHLIAVMANCDTPPMYSTGVMIRKWCHLVFFFSISFEQVTNFQKVLFSHYRNEVTEHNCAILADHHKRISGQQI